MKSCLFCSGDLLRHINNQAIYWYCSSCRQKLPDVLVQRHQLTPKGSNSKRHRTMHQGKILLLCQYHNPTGRPQIVRVTSGSGIDLERTVLPHQRITFHAVREAMLEVISGQPITAMTEGRIACKSLCHEVIKQDQRQVARAAESPRGQAIVNSLPKIAVRNPSEEIPPPDRGGSSSPFEKV